MLFNNFILKVKSFIILEVKFDIQNKNNIMHNPKLNHVAECASCNM